VAALLAVFCLLAGVAPANAQITFSILSPEADRSQGEPVQIVVFVNSASELMSVQATAGGRSVALTYSIGPAAWMGALSLDGLPRGPYDLVIEASNSGGQTAQVTRPFIYDKMPVLNLVQPVNYTVGQPDIPVKGECLDDAPGCRVTVSIGELDPVVVVGTPFDTVVRPPDGERRLRIRATDSTGRYVEVTRQIFVSAKGGLSTTQAFQGQILDIDATRALTYDDTVTPAALRLYDRITNTHQVIWTQAVNDQNQETVRTAFLTPNNGALFVMETLAVYPAPLFEWRGGALSQVGAAWARTLVVKGAWASFHGSTLPCCATHGFFLRDLTTGANIHATTSDGSLHGEPTPDGRLIYAGTPTPYQLFEFDPDPLPGTTTQLTSSALWSWFPHTDGINVVFLRAPDSDFSSPHSIVLRTQAGVEEVLATGHTYPERDSYYKVAGGWTAFVRRDHDGSRRIWLREPDGTLRPVPNSGFGFIEALSENGDVVFRSISTLYLAEVDGTVRELSAYIGKARFIDGVPFIIAGNQVVTAAEEPSRSILSEGATGTFFSTDVAILNPAAAAVPVTIRYFREGQAEIQQARTLPALSRTTIHLDDVPGLEGTSVSTQVDAPPGTPLVVERLMSWDDTGYGGHLGTAVDLPRRRWLFAEGAQGFFSTFFLIANSGASEATVKFTFLMEQGFPVPHTMTVPAASRRTFYAGDLAELVNRSFATIVESDLPIGAERAMYFGSSPLWLGGHGSAGVRTPSTTWFHAEGATGSLFDTFILIANPAYTAANVTVTFITDSGVTVTRQKSIPGRGRLTVNIEDEAPELANAAVSTLVKSDYDVVSERAMYWGTTGAGWREAHNSFGVTATGLKWGLAEGRAGGDRNYQTYVLVSNATADVAELKVTFIREDGTSIDKVYSAAAGQRLNIPASSLTELADSNFATIVESTNGVAINVESALYWNVDGVIWEAGGNTVATLIP
jgi:hypothetical protein